MGPALVSLACKHLHGVGFPVGTALASTLMAGRRCGANQRLLQPVPGVQGRATAVSEVGHFPEYSRAWPATTADGESPRGSWLEMHGDLDRHASTCVRVEAKS